MKGKKWFKKYGIHIAICAVVIGLAFGVNQKINLDRSHIYSVSEGIYTMLKDVTKAEVSGGKLELSGWGFDTGIYNESSRCELILQDTETGEALWPKMDKEPETPEIAERYTDGGDYSGAGFAGSLKVSALQETSVYEILVRYTTDYTDENGNAQQYVRTVSTDEFLYQGALTEYNPKTFVAPEIAGTELEKELSGARLFHWFEEGMWVYINNGKLYYLVDTTKLSLEQYPNGYMAVNWWANRLERIPEDYQQYKMGNADFSFMDYYSQDLSTDVYRVAVREIPSEYAVSIAMGFYDRDTSSYLYRTVKELKEN